MHRTRPLLVLLFLTMTALPLFADDQEKAEKQANRMNAMALDATGRRMVSMTMADFLKIERPALVRARRHTGLNYGSMFIAQQLIANGAEMEDIAAQLKAGKTVYQIANERKTDWKVMAGQAKKLYSKVESNLYKHFLNDTYYEADVAREQADKYDPNADIVREDGKVLQKDMEEAQARYMFLKTMRTWNVPRTSVWTAQKGMRPIETMCAHSRSREWVEGQLPPPVAFHRSRRIPRRKLLVGLRPGAMILFPPLGPLR